MSDPPQKNRPLLYRATFHAQSPGMATVPLTILLATEANGLRPQPGELICALIKPLSAKHNKVKENNIFY